MDEVAAMSKPSPVLELADVSVEIPGAAILNGINLRIQPGEVHVLFGPNGSGKSSMLKTIAGISPYVKTSGEIRLGGIAIDHLGIDERARLGIGLAFQNPPALDGVSVESFAAALKTTDMLADAMSELDLCGFEHREVGVGFSGGELKRWEVAKLVLQRPCLLLLDEPDSGVDLEHVSAIGDAIEHLLRQPNDLGVATSAVIVSHTSSILSRLDVDVGHLIVGGRLLYSGDPTKLMSHIEHNGYVAPDGAADAQNGKELS